MANGPTLPPQMPLTDVHGRQIGQAGPVAPAGKAPVAAKTGPAGQPGAIANAAPTPDAAAPPAPAANAPTAQYVGNDGRSAASTLARAKAPPLPSAAAAPVPMRYAVAPPYEDIVAGKGELSFGMKGPAVFALQQMLNANGATPQLKVDGFLGPNTLAALKAYQAAQQADAAGKGGVATGATLQHLQIDLTTSQLNEVRNVLENGRAISQGYSERVARTAPDQITAAQLAEADRDLLRKVDRGAPINGFHPMSQTDYGDPLGKPLFGQTIRNNGCHLTAFAIAASNKKDTNPAALNAALQKADGGFAMYTDAKGQPRGLTLMRENVAGKILGVQVGARYAPTPESLDAAIAAKRGVVVAVDYKGGHEPDHYITIVGKDDKGYVAIDSVGGRPFTMQFNNKQLVGRAWDTHSTYNARYAYNVG